MSGGPATLSFGHGLAGWSQLSVYGWDPSDTTWWAQLWRDGSRSDEPEMWLGYLPPAVRTLAALARLLVAVTGAGEHEVADALGEAVEALNPGDRSRD